ncbi:tetratricopeptide repeat protein [Bacteroides stercorirosoris]|uniref:Transcriptional regulator n=1 Tax=Bacteroides stercorirosoris TaxID=871324 RepID=A0A413GYX5_9BACE|nr:tetratricopeptide repeat protein [Bacteroides stercorirosoris]RGX76328.1 transcriptional regulator [Bacteroides stercorirosoris]
MKIKILLLLLIVSIGACTTSPNSTNSNDAQKWQQTITELNALLREKKHQKAIDEARQKLSQLLAATANATIPNDTLAKYARQILNLSYFSYLGSKQFRPGIEYLDSISDNPFLQQYCKHELLSTRASLHQMYGDNQAAIRLADEYLQLPEYEDADRYIPQAELVSGVYVYSGNDIPQAIRLLERAMECYHQGGSFQNMLRIISRLGIYYRLVGEYEKAVATNQEAINSYTDSIAPPNIVIAYGEQANLYAELGMYDRALQMNAKAQHYSLLKDSFGLGDLYRYRAEIFRKTQERDSVFYYLNQAEKVSAAQRSFKGVFVNKALAVDAYQDYPDSVQKALDLALSICPDSARMPQWARHQLNLHLGRALLHTGKATQGIALIEKAAKGYREMDMKEMEYSTNQILMEYYRNMRMDDAFFRCYDRNRIFADSLNYNERLRAVAAANIRFDTERQEKENKLLSAQVELQHRRLVFNICISIALLLILIISIAYFFTRKKANRLLLEKRKQEIQKLIASQQELNRHNEELSKQIEQIMATNNLNTISQLTGQNLLSKEDENNFRKSFAAIYPLYLPKLREKYPNLTRNEELLAMLICMNQSTDEIALIMGINRNSVNMIRSRMRKKINLTKEESLDEVIKQYLS